MNNKDLKEQAVRLRHQGKKYKEISDILGVSVDWCKRSLKGIKAQPLQNDIREIMCDHWYGREEQSVWPLWIDDIVSGVARLNWYGNREQQIPLSTTKIIQCFLWLDEFTTENIMELLNLGKRMSENYLKACTLCYPFLKKSLGSGCVKYPQTSIVSEAHGLAIGYSPYHTRTFS